MERHSNAFFPLTNTGLYLRQLRKNSAYGSLLLLEKRGKQILLCYGCVKTITTSVNSCSSGKSLRFLKMRWNSGNKTIKHNNFHQNNTLHSSFHHPINRLDTSDMMDIPNMAQYIMIPRERLFATAIS